MSLANYKEILTYAKEHNMAVGAFNSYNMESLQASASAAEKMGVPLIIQTYHSHMVIAGADYMAAIYRVAAEKYKTKIAIGLDHGKSFNQTEICIKAGYTGVMIDLASEDYEHNVKETKRVVDIAHSKNVSVEAELGKIFDADASLEDIATGYTDPVIARKFVEETGVDCLAVSIGTAHGFYTHTPKINFDLLEELVKTVPCPIVVHGGSYTPDEDILKMVKMGISKLNIGNEFFDAYRETMLKLLTEDNRIDCAELVKSARDAVEKVALKKIELLTAYKK